MAASSGSPRRSPCPSWSSSWPSGAISTQIATAGFAARTKQPVLVFFAATAALWAVATVAVIAGNRAGHLLNPKVTQKVAAVLFALVGVALIAGIF